jgi:hypothetical protein
MLWATLAVAGGQARIWKVSAREDLTAVAVAMLSIAEFGRKIVRVDRRPTQNLCLVLCEGPGYVVKVP